MHHLTLLLLLPLLAFVKDYGSVTVSRVVKVYDGDAITVDIDQWPKVVGESISVRIAGIDTPEMKDNSLPRSRVGMQTSLLNNSLHELFYDV